MLAVAGGLLALLPVVEELRVADALAVSVTATSFPSKDDPEEDPATLLAMAFGSNFPAYGAGEGTPFGVDGD